MDAVTKAFVDSLVDEIKRVDKINTAPAKAKLTALTKAMAKKLSGKKEYFTPDELGMTQFRKLWIIAAKRILFASTAHIISESYVKGSKHGQKIIEALSNGNGKAA